MTWAFFNALVHKVRCDIDIYHGLNTKEGHVGNEAS